MTIGVSKTMAAVAPLLAMLLFAASRSATSQDTPDEPQKMEDLKSVDDLKSQFNADKGKRRLLLLLSPT